MVDQENLIHQWGCLAYKSFLQKCYKPLNAVNPNLPITNTIFPIIIPVIE